MRKAGDYLYVFAIACFVVTMIHLLRSEQSDLPISIPLRSMEIGDPGR